MTPVVSVGALVKDVVRIVTPFVVSFVVGVAAHLGIKADTTTITPYVVAGLGVVLTAVARYVEAKWPKIGRFLLVFPRQLTITK